jgi:hypothetical protein
MRNAEALAALTREADESTGWVIAAGHQMILGQAAGVCRNVDLIVRAGTGAQQVLDSFAVDVRN